MASKTSFDAHVHSRKASAFFHQCLSCKSKGPGEHVALIQALHFADPHALKNNAAVLPSNPEQPQERDNCLTKSARSFRIPLHCLQYYLRCLEAGGFATASLCKWNVNYFDFDRIFRKDLHLRPHSLQSETANLCFLHTVPHLDKLTEHFQSLGANTAAHRCTLLHGNEADVWRDMITLCTFFSSEAQPSTSILL